MVKFYSQDKQDFLLETNLFKNYKNGFFVDVGAHDGVLLNNTLYFEENHNWTGINIEPIKEIYDKLILNRPGCINLNLAVDKNDGQSTFILNKGYTEMLSGLSEHYDPRHHLRREYENRQYKSISEYITVQTKTLKTIFQENNVNKINYLSIDVEGAESAVIQSIDFDSIFIDVIGFENNYPDTGKKIVDYLYEKGYKKLPFSNLDIFMIHENSKFCDNLK
jgi:FkbM family methyltransferase